MGAISTSERSLRLRSLAEAVFLAPKGISAHHLIAAACRKWGVTKRTAEEYVVVLVDSQVLKHDPPGGPLHCTSAGRRWLDKADDGEADPNQVLIPDPSPPSETTGGRG